MYHYKGTIKRIVDGDTLVIEVDLGFRIFQTMSFRLHGINTPEIVGEQKAEGLKAKNFLLSVIPEGTQVEIETFKDAKEKYGRYLARVTPNEVRIEKEDGTTQLWSGTAINDILLELGLANKYL